MKLNSALLRKDILSPGDIFWIKKSGDSLLVSKKGDAINFDLIKKLETAGFELVIENQIDQHKENEFETVYERYGIEVLMRDKIQWREKIVQMLVEEFVDKERDQAEMDLLGWKLFSKLKVEDARAFIERDSELFKRHLRIASSYTFCAFLLGYYESQFLSTLFSSTLESLMSLGRAVNAMNLKEKLDYLYFQDSLLPEDCAVVKEIADEDFLSKTVLFEKYDGSGLRSLNSREMSDLEIVLVALNSSYGFKKGLTKNVFSAIASEEFKCEAKTLRTLKRALEKKEKQAEMAA